MPSTRSITEAGVRDMAAPPTTIDPTRTALIVVDIANDVVHPDGAFASNPELDNSLYRDSLATLLRLVDACRAADMMWVAVCSAYDASYLPEPMRQRLDAMGILGAASPKGAWGSDVIDDLIERQPDLRVLKSHFSPFSPNAVCWRPGAAADLDAYLASPVTADAGRAADGRPTLTDLFALAASEGTTDTLDRLSAGSVASLDATLRAHDIDTLIVAGGATHVCEDATVAAASQHGYRIVEPYDACGSEDPDKHWVFLHNHGTFMTELCTADQAIDALR
jgi:nicotinamidase-related amidase